MRCPDCGASIETPPPDNFGQLLVCFERCGWVCDADDPSDEPSSASRKEVRDV